MESPYLQRHIPELDGLRGIAVAAVIAFHFQAKMYLPHAVRQIASFGWAGVDLFFVLSGFLIGGILIDQRGSANYFKTFYARRFFRIVPLYLLILAIYGAAWLLWDRPEHETMYRYFCSPMPWYSYLTFTNNFWIAAHDNMTTFLSPSWSLAVEEQFYLTLPLLVRFAKPKHLLPLICALAAVIVGSRAYAGHLGLVTWNQAYVLPWFRGDALLIGVMCAILVRSDKARSFVRSNAWALYATLAVLGAALCNIGLTLGPEPRDPTTPLVMFGYTVLALFWAALLLLTVLRPGPLRALRFRPLAEVGKVSYCLYLVHVICIHSTFQFVEYLGGSRRFSYPQALFIFGAVLFFMFILAQLSWGLFESQMIRVGYRFHFVPPSHQLIPGAEVPVPVAAGA